MNRQHLYEELISRKLNGIAAPDVTQLWPDMKAMLDREMPQQNKKRFGGWRLNSCVLLIACLVTVGSVYGVAQQKAKAPDAKATTIVSDTQATNVTESAGGPLSVAEKQKQSKPAKTKLHSANNALHTTRHTIPTKKAAPADAAKPTKAKEEQIEKASVVLTSEAA